MRDYLNDPELTAFSTLDQEDFDDSYSLAGLVADLRSF
jgi:hypothetical protein